VGGTDVTHGRGEESVQGFSGKVRMKRSFGGPRCKSEDGIRMDLREIRWGCRLDPAGSG
jgi:hypothetical protein